MPTPDKVTQIGDINRQAIEKLNSQHQPKLASGEVAELRKEIAELRALFTPSIILTGQRVIEEYWRLTARDRRASESMSAPVQPHRRVHASISGRAKRGPAQRT